MAIAFDAASDGGHASGTSLTWSHTCTGADLIMFVLTYGDSDAVTGATYNSASMTLVAKQAGTVNGELYLFYLVAPSTGTNTVAVSSGSSTNIYGDAVSYTGAAQTGQPDSFNSSVVAGGTNYTIATTVVAANSWTVLAYLNQSTSVATAGSGTTRRVVNGSYGGFALLDSNGPLSTGSNSLNVTVGLANSVGVIASFSPVASGGSGNPWSTYAQMRRQ